MMAKFTNKLILFLLPVILGLLSLEVGNRYIPTEYSTKYENFIEQQHKIELLIVGSSHGLRGVNPHGFENLNAYSMAMVSQKIFVDRDIIIEHIENLPELKVVILSVSYFSLTENLMEGNFLNRRFFYENIYGLNYQDKWLSLYRWSSIANLGIRRSLRRSIKHYVFDSTTTLTDEKGWMGEGGASPKNSFDFVESAIEAADRHEDNRTDVKKNVDVFEDIMDVLGNKDVHLILVNTPKSNEYVNRLSKEKSQLIDSTFFSMAHNKPFVHYFNFQREHDFERTHFQNGDHLNERGAKKLTQKLDNYITENLLAL